MDKQNNIYDLVGKLAVRTEPCITNYGKDNSYRDEPIKILKVTDTHIVYWCEVLEKKYLLSKEWNDGKWIDYEELIGIQEEPKELLIVLKYI